MLLPSRVNLLFEEGRIASHYAALVGLALIETLPRTEIKKACITPSGPPGQFVLFETGVLY